MGPNKGGKETKLNKILQHDAIFLLPKQASIPSPSRDKSGETCVYMQLFFSAPSRSSCPHDFSTTQKIPLVPHGIQAFPSLHLSINVHVRGYQAEGHSQC